jgi:cysteine-rich repeat protein
MLTGEPRCNKKNGITQLHRGSIRVFALALVGLATLVGGQMAWAHQSPANCTGNQLFVGLLKDKTSILSGETVTFTVTVRNDAATACDVTGANITFHCPAADGTPTGAATVCASNADFLEGFPLTNLCVVPCTVNFNPGVTSAQALVDGGGTLHDNPDNDFDTADIHRTLSVIVRTCGDGVLNQTCETCDTNAFPATAPSSHGACRTGGDCGVNSCTFCGDGILNGGEQCDDGNAVDIDACHNNCTPPSPPCSVIIAKTVAPDDGSGGGTACDGVADGPFVESVTVDQTSCVVYQICVTNTSQQVLDTNGVKVSDPVLGTVNFDFGTIAPGATVCKQAPSVITAPNCTGGSPAGTSCLCSDVDGVNTATITSAICENTNQDACAQPGSDCSDTANVACLTEEFCPTFNPAFGPAADCTILNFGGSFTSTGPAGQYQGDLCMADSAHASFSGSNFVTGKVRLAPDATCSGCTPQRVLGGVELNADLTTEVQACQDARENNTPVSLGGSGPECTETVTTLQSIAVNGTITRSGTNIICLTQNQTVKGLELAGDASTKYVFIVEKAFKFQDGKLQTVAPVGPDDVLWVFVGATQSLTSSGGGGGASCCKAVLDGSVIIDGKIALAPGLINGQVCGTGDFVSGSGLHCPPEQ